MGRIDDAISSELATWLAAQPVFFVGSAPLDGDGHVNVSPKGVQGTFAVLDEHTVAYLDFNGSGVETIAHARENGRITLMFCAFVGPPRIVRLSGKAEVVLLAEDAADSHPSWLASFDAASREQARSVIVVHVGRVSTSCGYGVPRMDYRGDRDELVTWAVRKGPEGLAAYRGEKNVSSIDGLPGIPL